MRKLRVIFLVIIGFIAVMYVAARWDSKPEVSKNTQQESNGDESTSRIKSMDEVEQIVKEKRDLPENQIFMRNFRGELKKFTRKQKPLYKKIEANDVDYNSIGLVITYDNEISALQAPIEAEELARFIVQYAVKHGKQPTKDSFVAIVQVVLKFKGETEDRYANLGKAIYDPNKDLIYWESSN